MRRRIINATFPGILAVATVFGPAGCGKKAAQQVAMPPVPAAVQTPSLQGAQIHTPTQPGSQNGELDLAQINRTLIRWIIRNKRRPASFEDFAATAEALIPVAPAGKKYVLAANMHVQLASQ